MKPSKTTQFLTLLLGFCYCALTLFSQSSLAENVWLFLGLMTLANALLFVCVFRAWYRKEAFSARYVMSWAIAFHLLGLFGLPLFEDDYFRYLWDAYHTAQHGTPYGVSPSNYFNQPIKAPFADILGQINYPDIPTVYGSVFQYSFLLGYWIAPGEVWPLQLIYSLTDLVLIWVLLKLASPIKVALYAWCPLVFKEVILTAHPDGLAVCLLVIAVYCLQTRRPGLMAFTLATSVAAKIFAIIAVPFLLWKIQVRYWLLCLICLAGLYAPLLLNLESDLLGLTAMASDWEFNSALYGLLRLGLDDGSAKLLLAMVLMLGVGGYWLKFSGLQQEGFRFLNTTEANQKTRPPVNIPRLDWVYAGVLLCMPVINPWYWLWVLPFAAIHLNPTAWLASAMLMMAYLTGWNLDWLDQLGPYHQPVWVRPIEFGVILLASLGYWAFWRRPKKPRNNPMPVN